MRDFSQFNNVPDMKPINNRKIDIMGYADELGEYFEIHGEIRDLRQYDSFNTMRGNIPFGEPLHYMQVMMRANRDKEILDITAKTHHAPFTRCCVGAADQYHILIGLKIAPGFKQKMRELLPANLQCTHISELLPQMATVLFQTIHAYDQKFKAHIPNSNGTNSNEIKKSDEKLAKYMLNSCHAFHENSDVVKTLMPAFYKGDKR